MLLTMHTHTLTVMVLTLTPLLFHTLIKKTLFDRKFFGSFLLNSEAVIGEYTFYMQKDVQEQRKASVLNVSHRTYNVCRKKFCR